MIEVAAIIAAVNRLGAYPMDCPEYPREKRNESVNAYLQRFAEYLTAKDAYDAQVRADRTLETELKGVPTKGAE